MSFFFGRANATSQGPWVWLGHVAQRANCAFSHQVTQKPLATKLLLENRPYWGRPHELLFGLG